MADDTTLDIVFRGDIVLGHALPDVKKRLQQLFKADAAKIDALFTGRPVPLKRNLDPATARKYEAVLKKAGAEVALVPSGEVGSGEARRPEPRRRGLSLAPAGVNLLKSTERREQAPVEVDISALSLRPAEGDLLDTAERQNEQASPVAVPSFDLAEAGEDLVREDERQDLPLPEIDVEDWGLADAGDDLVRPEERQSRERVEVADLAVDLAPVGSELGQLKDDKPPVNVDISRIKLQE